MSGSGSGFAAACISAWMKAPSRGTGLGRSGRHLNQKVSGWYRPKNAPASRLWNRGDDANDELLVGVDGKHLVPGFFALCTRARGAPGGAQFQEFDGLRDVGRLAGLACRLVVLAEFWPL